LYCVGRVENDVRNVLDYLHAEVDCGHRDDDGDGCEIQMEQDQPQVTTLRLLSQRIEVTSAK
jgi:hypothetical protein